MVCDDIPLPEGGSHKLRRKKFLHLSHTSSSLLLLPFCCLTFDVVDKTIQELQERYIFSGFKPSEAPEALLIVKK